MLGEGEAAEVGRRYSFSPVGWLGAWHPGLQPAIPLGPGSPPFPTLLCFLAMDPVGTHCLPLGEGCLPVARHPGSIRAFGAAMLLAPSFLLLLSLLALPAPSHAWSRPLWYQVGLDLQPWGCQPNSLEGCGGSLGCPGHWMGLAMNRIYPVAGVTITTTMMLMVGRAVLQRRRSQATKSEVSEHRPVLCSLLPPLRPASSCPPPHPPTQALCPLPRCSHPVVPTSVHTHQPLTIPCGQYSAPICPPIYYPYSSSSPRSPRDHPSPQQTLGDPPSPPPFLCPSPWSHRCPSPHPHPVPLLLLLSLGPILSIRR